MWLQLNIFLSVTQQMHHLTDLCQYSSQTTLCALVEAIAKEAQDESEEEKM